MAEDIGVSFYEKLQKKSTLFRDEQGKESDIFLEYFGVVRSEDDKRPEESEIVRLPGTVSSNQDETPKLIELGGSCKDIIQKKTLL